MLTPADVLNDRYRLDAPIGSGGMGEVWRATDISLGRTVALKIMRAARLPDSNFDARFRAEARTMAAVHHPNVVNIYDYGHSELDDGSSVSYLVMTYVDGESLRDRLANGPLPLDEAMAILAQAADALHAVHQHGIIHRDVKPANLLVQPDGTVTLVDFGVARSDAVTSVTTANAILGTAMYMAPEQASGRKVSPATDIYALGAVAFHCLAGTPPFTGETALEIALKHVSDEPPALPDEVPPAARALVERSLAKDATDRYATAAAFAAAARAAAAEPDVVPAPETAAEPDTGDEGDAASAGSGDKTAKLPAGAKTAKLVPGAKTAKLVAGAKTGRPAAAKPAKSAKPVGAEAGKAAAELAAARPAPGPDGAATPQPREQAGRRRTGILTGAGAVVLVALASLAFLLGTNKSTPPVPAPRPSITPSSHLPAALPESPQSDVTKRPADVDFSHAPSTVHASPTPSRSTPSTAPTSATPTPTATDTSAPPNEPPSSPTPTEGQPTPTGGGLPTLFPDGV